MEVPDRSGPARKGQEDYALVPMYASAGVRERAGRRRLARARPSTKDASCSNSGMFIYLFVFLYLVVVRSFRQKVFENHFLPY